MARYEFIKGTSRKFWEITLTRNSLVTRFGRIGTEGQISEKRFADAVGAKKAYDALVREKTNKGYVLAGATKKSAGSASISKPASRGEPKHSTTASKSRTPSVDDAGQVRNALSALDTFLAALTKRPPFALELSKRVPPVKAAAIATFEKRTGRALSPGARELFLGGFPTCVIAGDAEFGFGALDFVPLAKIEGTLKWWGDWKSEADAIGVSRDPGLLLRAEQRRYGVPLWQDENTIVVDSRTGAVSRTSGEPTPSDPIAASLGEFLTHFVAAGCFSYGAADRRHFRAYWKLVADLVPYGIAPEKNLWLQHLDRWYRGNITRVR